MIRRVMIATPAHDGKVCVEYAHSLYYSGLMCTKAGIDLFPVWLPHESLLQRARNQLARLALSANPQCDDVLFIDADQEWEPKDVIRILGHKVDVVGAPVRKKTEAQELYNVRVSGSSIPVDLKSGLLLVDAVGTGFLRVSRRALEAAWSQSEPYRDAGHEHRMVFELRILEGDLCSEDTVFCAKLGAAGFNIYVDPKIKVAHLGSKKFQGDFENWLATRHKGTPAVA